MLASSIMRVDPVFVPVVPPSSARPLASFGVIMIAVMWTYEGWYYVAFAAGEIRERRAERAARADLGTLALTAIYVGVNSPTCSR